jgi:hypothetical protein
MQALPPHAPHAGAAPLPPDQGRGYEVELRDVRFSYRPDQPILDVRP